MTRVLVAGAGSVGRRHIDNLKTLGAQPVVAITPGGSATKAADELDVPLTDFDLEIERADAVVVASPPDSHMTYLNKALSWGKPCFVEKPLAPDGKGFAGLAGAAAGKVVEVGCQLRTHPTLRVLRDRLNEGDGGPIETFRFAVGQNLRDWRPSTDYRNSYSADPRRGGGALFDLIHEIDLAIWFAGPVVSVSGMLRKSSAIDADVDGVANIMARTRSGTVGQIQQDIISPVFRRELEIVCRDAIWRWKYVDGVLTRDDSSGVEVVSVPPVEFTRNDMFLSHMGHFLERVSDPTIRPVCSLEDGMHAIEVAIAVRQSSEVGQHVAVSQ